ncbi:DUF1788 domain-containing protein [Altererythrobacter sp. TH136]|uniref:DUF1788 domain-containing protein n=1 Tax=Altererythrobacter sp. TH136 TaxID=2067415 RepID=UPI001165356E|nr:DUF1788 domain-containing protein [Altererythrobacter sp. TH136]QDM40804.1 DUF1788 domain-containing protein [Altererythrobacter sp. TH136]
MASFEEIMSAYRRHLSLPWASNLSDAERTWILWYAPALERRITAQAIEFEQAAREAGYGWRQVELSSLIPSWLATNRHARRLMKRPNEIAALSGDLLSHLTQAIRTQAEAQSERDILALFGAGALFGLVSVASVIETAAPFIRGRLLVAFPGVYEGGRYRLLDARDSWNYHATPIPPTSYL